MCEWVSVRVQWSTSDSKLSKIILPFFIIMFFFYRSAAFFSLYFFCWLFFPRVCMCVVCFVMLLSFIIRTNSNSNISFSIFFYLFLFWSCNSTFVVSLLLGCILIILIAHSVRERWRRGMYAFGYIHKMTPWKHIKIKTFTTTQSCVWARAQTYTHKHVHKHTSMLGSWKRNMVDRNDEKHWAYTRCLVNKENNSEYKPSAFGIIIIINWFWVNWRGEKHIHTYTHTCTLQREKRKDGRKK